MGRKIAILALVAAAICGIGIGINGMREARAVKENLDALVADRDASADKVSAKDETIRSLRDEIASLKEELEALRVSAAADKSEKDATVAGDAGEAKKNPFASMMKGFRDNPDMKEMMAKQQELAVDRTYQALLDNLDLTEEEAAEFRARLVERQIAMMEQGFELMSGEKSKEEKEALGKELAEQQTAWREEIKNLIGEENYERFDLYEKSQPERQQISSFKQGLEGTDYQLSFEQEETLMSAMYEERKKFKFTKDLEKQDEDGAADVLNLNPEAVDLFTEENQRLQETIYGRAAEILTPEQLEQFARSQERHRAMQEFGMEMGVQMMQGTQEETAESQGPGR